MADQDNRSIPIVPEKAGVQILKPSAIFTIPSVGGLWTPDFAGVTDAGLQARAPVGNDNASAKDHREGLATRRVRRHNGSEKLSKGATVASDRIRHNEHCMDDYGDCRKVVVAMHEWGHARRLKHSPADNITYESVQNQPEPGDHDRGRLTRPLG